MDRTNGSANRSEHRDDVPVLRADGAVVPSGQVVLFEQYRLFSRSWKWVLLIAVVATVCTGLYFYLFVPKTYTATAVALPPNKSQTPLDDLLGGVASSLKDFGLRKLVGGTGGGEGYARTVLLTSQPVLDSLIDRFDLFAEYAIDTASRSAMRSTLSNNIEVDVDMEGPVSVTATDRDPVRAARIANELVRVTNVVAMDLNRRETLPITAYIKQRYTEVQHKQDSLTALMRTFMESSHLYDMDNQPGIVGAAVQEIESQIAEQRALVATLEENLGPNDSRVVQARQVLDQLEKSSRRLASGTSGAVPGVDLTDLPRSAERYFLLEFGLEANSKILALLEPMYEQSILDQARNIPVFNLLTPAEPPTHKSGPHLSIVVAGTFLGTFLMCYLVIAVVAYMRAFAIRYRRYRAMTSLAEARATVGAEDAEQDT